MCNRSLVANIAWVAGLCLIVGTACKQDKSEAAPQSGGRKVADTSTTSKSPADASKLKSEAGSSKSTDAPASKENVILPLRPDPSATPQPDAQPHEQTGKVIENKDPTNAIKHVNITPMDPLTEVQYFVAEGWNEIRSIHATMKVTYDDESDQERHHTGEGTSDLLREGSLIRTKSRLGTMMKYKPDDPELEYMIEGQRLTRVTDGTYLYSLTERSRGAVATKRYANHRFVRYLGGAPLYRFLRSLKNLKKLPNEAVNDRYAFVLEGELPLAGLTFRHYLDQENGVLLKMVVENEAAKSKSVTEFTDLEFNVEFPEGHFDFKTPDGVEIVDLTAPGAGFEAPPGDDEHD